MGGGELFLEVELKEEQKKQSELIHEELSVGDAGTKYENKSDMENDWLILPQLMFACSTICDGSRENKIIFVC